MRWKLRVSPTFKSLNADISSKAMVFENSGGYSAKIKDDERRVDCLIATYPDQVPNSVSQSHVSLGDVKRCVEARPFYVTQLSTVNILEWTQREPGVIQS
jgi:hypothetical protein